MDGEPFQLRMRFGLHAGWAIEGAVGSAHKASKQPEKRWMQHISEDMLHPDPFFPSSGLLPFITNTHRLTPPTSPRT